jgi:hypothetical protein
VPAAQKGVVTRFTLVYDSHARSEPQVAPGPQATEYRPGAPIRGASVAAGLALRKPGLDLAEGRKITTFIYIDRDGESCRRGAAFLVDDTNIDGSLKGNPWLGGTASESNFRSLR